MLFLSFEPMENSEICWIGFYNTVLCKYWYSKLHVYSLQLLKIVMIIWWKYTGNLRVILVFLSIWLQSNKKQDMADLTFKRSTSIPLCLTVLPKTIKLYQSTITIYIHLSHFYLFSLSFWKFVVDLCAYSQWPNIVSQVNYCNGL